MFTAKHIISSFSTGTTATEEQLTLSHTHERRELLCVIEGTSRCMFNNQSFEATPGSIFFIDHWQQHANGYLPEDHAMFHLWLSLDTPAAISVTPLRISSHGEYSLRSPSFQLPPEFSMLIERRWNHALQHAQGNPAVFERLLREPVNATLDEISLRLSQYETQPPNTSLMLVGIIENVKQFIRTTNARGCTLARLEKLSGYNRFYLAHCFRQLTGSTIGAFINDVRLEYTTAALQKGMRQKEIASELGFSSPANFWNWYQKHRS